MLNLWITQRGKGNTNLLCVHPPVTHLHRGGATGPLVRFNPLPTGSSRFGPHRVVVSLPEIWQLNVEEFRVWVDVEVERRGGGVVDVQRAVLDETWLVDFQDCSVLYLTEKIEIVIIPRS